MDLQSELNEIREYLQAVVDYVGRDKVAAAMVANRARREQAAPSNSNPVTEDKTP